MQSGPSSRCGSISTAMRMDRARPAVNERAVTIAGALAPNDPSPLACARSAERALRRNPITAIDGPGASGGRWALLFGSANWTTMPWACRGCRNASFHCGSESS